MEKTIFEMLKTLIGLSSVSSKDPVLDQSNRSVIDCLAEWLNDLGFSVEIIPSEGAADKFNLIASAGSGEGGLLFSGHTDTVPFDETKWTSNPLVLREDNGKWYGLGTSEMKGFFPVLIESVRKISLTSLRKPLYVIATADEESSMSGIRTLYEAGMPEARYGIIGEPTSLKPVYMNKGIVMEAVRLTGVPGHSSNPARGRNAIDGMYNIMQALMVWRESLKEHYSVPDFEVAYPTVNFGRIFGGDSPNRICPSCELHFDIRLVPGMDIEQTRGELQSRVYEAINGMGFTVEIFHLFPGVPPMQTPADSHLVRHAEQITGAKARAVQFATEGYFYNTFGMDTIILGPGDINTAHQPDEYLNSAVIKPAVNVYRSLIQALCIQED